MVPPGKARNLLLGLFAASPPVGGVVGALLAGLCANFDEFWSWTILFASIAGSSALCLALLCVMMPRENHIDKDGKIDFVGACLGLSSLILYNLAWNQAPSVGWSTPYEIAILLLSVVLFASFLLWERSYVVDPVMPLKIFKAPTFLALIVVVLFSYMAFGIALCLLLATMPVNQSYWPQKFPAMVLCGFCPDFVYLAAQVIASNSVSRKYQGVASSLVGTLNLYGVSLRLGFAGTIETEVNKTATKSETVKNGEEVVAGFRAALCFSAAHAAIGLLLNFWCVRLPKTEPEG
ncbi:hypothetical protein QQS21_012427 [Conoideocrella luteorostrata]|uniref:Major facilitator superfamily (MFS) profile domain-containing protein n=1 Tax=Conoideocrella luteorostrata TaxID=1105319 RepID=A0AAJ0FMN6_9HYPO|nr:hypothetical protein QQS21_012427 [Conoideocrella luteorostrata]